jgi:rhodanese-related sulfurtransferase
MAVDINSEEAHLVRRLIPLSTLSLNQFELLCKDISIERARTGTFLFRQKDINNDLFYLLKGTITLQSQFLKIEKIKAGTESALFAIAHQIPRKIDAYCNSSVSFLRINADDLNASRSLKKTQQREGIIVDEADEDDWINVLLQSPIFNALPPVGLQQVIMGLNEVSFKQDELIIEQGKQGGFYYFIKEGACLMTHKTEASNPKTIELATLKSQDAFGEDSLISEESSHISVSAITDVSLFRLSKDTFISFIKEPSVSYINHSQIKEEVDNNALLLDVRDSEDFTSQHLPGSVNIPFFLIREKLAQLNKKKTIVIVCHNGKRSEAAAFLLQSYAYTALAVEGGLKQKYKESTVDTAEPNIEPASSISSKSKAIPEEVVENKLVKEEKKDGEDDDLQKLQEENQQLKLTVKELTEGKENIEEKYRALYKKMEQAMAFIERLKIGK